MKTDTAIFILIINMWLIFGLHSYTESVRLEAIGSYASMISFAITHKVCP